MKVVRTATVFLLCALLLSAFACGGGPPAQPPTQPTQEPAATATAEPTSTVTPTLTPTPTPTPTYEVYILEIDYLGKVLWGEPDEYVAIINNGDISININDWVLKDVTDGYPTFTFPDYVLGHHNIIRVYTKEYHPDWGGFRFDESEGVWNNTHPDTAALYDARGHLVSEASYEIE
jgi:hypothetical protein